MTTISEIIPIDGKSPEEIRRALEEAMKSPRPAILLSHNSPGGEVGSLRDVIVISRESARGDASIGAILEALKPYAEMASLINALPPRVDVQPMELKAPPPIPDLHISAPPSPRYDRTAARQLHRAGRRAHAPGRRR